MKKKFLNCTALGFGQIAQVAVLPTFKQTRKADPTVTDLGEPKNTMF